MEVATVITSCEDICTLFDKFIYLYPSLFLYEKDDNTAFFSNINNDKSKIFYHYKLNDRKSEFSYNYSDDEITQINNFYADKRIYMFDLSYNQETVLVEMLKAFKLYVKTHSENLLSTILISHPFDGLKSLEEQY